MNYVVIRNGRHQLYAQGGGAGYSLDYHFAIGPAAALRWLDQLDDCRTDEWFDDLSCEGGVLIDVDHRTLLMFSLLGHVALGGRYDYRAALLEAYGRTWAGWKIRWAYDGIGDLVAYLGQDRQAVRQRMPARPALYEDGEGWSDGPIEFLVSVLDDAGRRAYGLTEGAQRPWLGGPQLMAELDGRHLVSSCRTIPTAGLHLDLSARRAGLWSIIPLKGVTETWPARWPGWGLELWAADYGQQVSSGSGAVRLPAVDLAWALAALAKRLDNYWPVEEHLRANDVDVDRVRELNLGGIATHLAARVTPEALATAAATIACSHTDLRSTSGEV
ncbi:hypothetical protein [Micromonospora sp. NPDC005113]